MVKREIVKLASNVLLEQQIPLFRSKLHFGIVSLILLVTGVVSCVFGFLYRSKTMSEIVSVPFDKNKRSFQVEFKDVNEDVYIYYTSGLFYSSYRGFSNSYYKKQMKGDLFYTTGTLDEEYTRYGKRIFPSGRLPASFFNFNLKTNEYDIEPIESILEYTKGFRLPDKDILVKGPRENRSIKGFLAPQSFYLAAFGRHQTPGEYVWTEDLYNNFYGKKEIVNHFYHWLNSSPFTSFRKPIGKIRVRNSPTVTFSVENLEIPIENGKEMFELDGFRFEFIKESQVGIPKKLPGLLLFTAFLAFFAFIVIVGLKLLVPPRSTENDITLAHFIKKSRRKNKK